MSTGSSLLSGHCSILEPSQWKLVRQMRLEALKLFPEAFLGDYSAESMLAEEDWRKTFESASWHGFFIAADIPEAGRIAGIARSSVLTQFPTERYVESFWVRPDFRRRQVGRRVLHSIVCEASKERRKAIRLSVLRSNDEAIRAFRSLGISAEVADRSSEDEICFELLLP